ncbi:single-stranded DNA-binding protein [Lentibacillus salicampi]|uniref:Single-stranded DNA-binding protein n=1 Tax=Lentibacillus salicampi TaxID=175306 RepID=A0A4Y9A8P9_9BACI|nr:single-stranded DNA-binding protein [Lentibacillus salicampi]TFJ92163.1 single-stranded DNA-binding protein [Lentibacillus salicampi]
MINNVTLVGRLTADPDLRYTQNGTAVANFRLAVNRPFTNQNGENEVDFINCVVWRRPAENLANYMKKGSQIGITGRIQTRNYENNEGRTIYVTEVVADNVAFLESKKQSNNQSSNQSNSQQQTDKSNTDPFKDNGEPIDISDSDLPF